MVGARARRLAVVLAGIVVPQALLVGPALVGRKILLDLPILGEPGVYLPVDAARPSPPPHDPVLSDPVLQFEPYRVYATQAVRHGRIPLWSRLNYCGSPFLAANQTAVFSPYRLIDYAWPGPAAIAWTQLAKALVAGIGAYVYFRRALRVGPAAAVAGAWCVPLGGFLTLWSSHPHSAVASWLPWILLAADGAARRPRGLSGGGLALATAAVLLSGHAATGVHVLIGAGLQGAFSLVHEHRGKGVGSLLGGALSLSAGLLLGVLLSAPQTFPTLEYMRASSRIQSRAAGHVETPPAGAKALPLVALPYFEGATFTGAVFIGRGNRQESAATAYAGFLLVLVAAPLALRGRRRAEIAFAALLVVVGLAQVLDLPLLSPLLESWPLRAMRNNRLTVLAGFGLACLGVLGLDALATGRPSRRFALVAAAPALVLGLWSLARALTPPPLLDDVLFGVPAASAAPLRGWFASMNVFGAALGAGALACWLAIARRPPSPSTAWVLGVFCLVELTLCAVPVFPLSDPWLYYPRLPALEALARAPAGRICGIACLPPNLNQRYALPDVRGFDGADPARLLELLQRIGRPDAPRSPAYARTLSFVPSLPSPAADMLGLRYLVLRGDPPPGVHPLLTAPDYYVLENPAALPRVWVPRRVERVADAAERLRRLTEPSFDARDVAFVESEEAPVFAAAAGEARIVTDEEERLTIAVDMSTEGLVVVADLWDPGWKAFVDGVERRVHRVNHALRGVVVARGSSRVEMRYEPASFRRGLLAALAAVAAAGGWAVAAVRAGRRAGEVVTL
jgi:hypothetical protein